MKHAGRDALEAIEPLLESIRAVPGLTERQRGVFYRKSKAFLHFHEDPSGMHADVRVGEEFERYRAETPAERASLVKLVRAVAGDGVAG